MEIPRIAAYAGRDRGVVAESIGFTLRLSVAIIISFAVWQRQSKFKFIFITVTVRFDIAIKFPVAFVQPQCYTITVEFG